MSNVIKFQAPFERLKLYDASPDVNLRKAIITQAIIDSTNISDKKPAKKLEREAKSWIFGCGDHFKNICIEAGMEHSLVIKLTKEIIKLHKSKSKNNKKQPNANKTCEIVKNGRPKNDNIV